MNQRELWKRFQRYLCVVESLGLRLDISRMAFADDLFEKLTEPITAALDAMERLERGAIANADEERMVGHYWLRTPELAPDEAIRTEVRQTIKVIKSFAARVHDGVVVPKRDDGFFVVLLIGIGGSALGPQFVCDALTGTDDPLIIRFLDNTDPDGIDRILDELDEALPQTLVITVSKSGGTVETRNAMLETAGRFERAGLNFAKHAVAITCEGSDLDRQARREGWLATFPMWDWVGGRTSVLSAVSLLPAALVGIDIDALLEGARICDEATRCRNVAANPAALLALTWYDAVRRRNKRNMVVMPYRDRLVLVGRYLQQLIMESIGKQFDRAGHEVLEGLTVYGQKGTTDQHAYVQQLREGTDDFFAIFVEALEDRHERSIDVEPGVTSGDYLSGFLQGTRDALTENGRESITLTLDRVDARSIGALVALFERAIGLYAELINVNAYHQPGVEAGKKAARAVIDLQGKVLAYLHANPERELTADELAAAIGRPDAAEHIFHLLEHAAANPDHAIIRTPGPSACQARYAPRH